MKIFKYVFVVVGALLMALAAFGPALGQSPEVKVTLCHLDGQSGKYSKIDVSGNSVENKDNWLNGHGGHSGDIWAAFTLTDGTQVAAQGDQSILANDCEVPQPPEPTATTPPEPTVTNTPVPPEPTATTPPGQPTNTPKPPVEHPTSTPPEQNTAGGTSGPNFLLIGLAGAALFSVGLFFPNAKAKIRH